MKIPKHIIKLGSNCHDPVTGLDGAVTHLQIEMNHHIWYCFQPRGLDRETLQPIKRMWVADGRLTGGKLIDTPDLPVEALNTVAEDTASGFSGTAVAMTMHIDGCVHLQLQPPGVIEKTGAPIDPADFNILRLTGPGIPVLTEAEKDESRASKPSPGPDERHAPSMSTSNFR